VKIAKRLLLSGFVASVACGLSFYIAYFAGLIYTSIAGPLHPVNDLGLQWVLRHIALPTSLVIGSVIFAVAFRRFGKSGHRPSGDLPSGDRVIR